MCGHNKILEQGPWVIQDYKASACRSTWVTGMAMGIKGEYYALSLCSLSSEINTIGALCPLYLYPASSCPTVPDLPPYSPHRKSLNTEYYGWVVLKTRPHVGKKRDESSDVNSISRRNSNSTQLKSAQRDWARDHLKQFQSRIWSKRFGYWWEINFECNF